MTKKIELTPPKLLEVSPPRYSLLNLPSTDVKRLSDTFTTSSISPSSHTIFAGPIATDFELLRTKVEPPLPISTTPIETGHAPRVPSFDLELVPLLPDLGKRGAEWKTTVDDIEDHYAQRRREIEADRQQALETIRTSTDLTTVRHAQALVTQLEQALFQVHQELTKLQTYRHNKLTEVA